MSHRENLERVAVNIGTTVIEFCRLHKGLPFVAAELRGYVTLRHPGTAPESPGRILREMKRRGVVNYELVSRAQSLYRVIGVRVVE